MKRQRHIFLGGTGRSGTTLLGTMLACHPDVLFFGEPWFLVEANGVNDYLNGPGDVEAFRMAMRNRFRVRMNQKLTDRGYGKAVACYTPDAVDALLDANFVNDRTPEMQVRGFIKALFDLGLQAEAKQHWVEKTPRSIVMVDTLYRLFPDLRYVHIIRDPVQVCASFLRRDWGFESVEAVVRNYCHTMEQAWRSYSRIPAKQYRVISLESLAERPADVVRHVFRFVGLACSRTTLERCVARVSPERIRAEAWREQLTQEDVLLIENACGPIYERWRGLERPLQRFWRF